MQEENYSFNSYTEEHNQAKQSNHSFHKAPDGSN
ncbi:hypothetical protein GGD38_003572 [Chitinophagaceae bacterium OAS944]|nr:hypothetical protein [Chitinophagaceae bacterium OAS944]